MKTKRSSDFHTEQRKCQHTTGQRTRTTTTRTTTMSTLMMMMMSVLVVSALLAATAVVDAVPALRANDDMYAKLDGADEFADVDNVEWHHVKVVDGLLEEDHPIIMYKEDFVSEDFDPSKNRTGETGTRHASRKYKNIAHRRRNRLHHNNNNKNNNNDDDTTGAAVVTEKYRALKPQKMLFDVLPQKPLLTAADDNSAALDPKFDPSKIRVEVISLTDDTNNHNNQRIDADAIQIEGGDEMSKQMLSKRPKKYHRRARRSAPVPEAVDGVADGDEHVRGKRNPYIRRTAQTANGVLSVTGGGGNWVLVPVVNSQQAASIRHSVRGKFWNGLYLEVPSSGSSSGQSNIDDDIQFGTRGDFVNTSSTERPPRRRGPITVEDIFHDSNPQNADTSFASRAPPANSNNPSLPTQAPARPRTTTRPPATTRSPPRGNIGGGIVYPGETATTVQPPPLRTDLAVTNCMWAIVSCCSTNNVDLRYDCFEQFSCSGAFWDLNPCADPVRDNLVNFVNDAYD